MNIHFYPNYLAHRVHVCGTMKMCRSWMVLLSWLCWIFCTCVMNGELVPLTYMSFHFCPILTKLEFVEQILLKTSSITLWKTIQWEPSFLCAEANRKLMVTSYRCFVNIHKNIKYVNVASLTVEMYTIMHDDW